MVCFYFLILIPLITATRRFDGPISYRSSIMEGDKPILRMSPNGNYEESISDESRQTPSPPKTKDPALVRDLGLLVNWLMENFSYDVVPMGRKNNNDEGDDKVAPKIEITEPLTENPVEPPVDSENSDGALRTKHKTKKHTKEEPNPKWIKDLKDFIKDLTTRYGQHEVLEHARPVIVLDEYGEIHITYIEKGKGKKTARKRKNSDET